MYIRKLTPEYELGCKRIVFSDDFYPALARSNVDVITQPITDIVGNTIYCADGVQSKVALILIQSLILVGRRDYLGDGI